MNRKIDWFRLVGIVVMAALLVAGTGGVVLANDAMDARHLVDKARMTLDSFDRAKDMSAFRDLLKDAKGVFIAPQILEGCVYRRSFRWQRRIHGQRRIGKVVPTGLLHDRFGELRPSDRRPGL